jgi:hypothetical protein
MKTFRNLLVLLTITFSFLIYSCSKPENNSNEPNKNQSVFKSGNTTVYTLTVDHIVNNKGYWQDPSLSKLEVKDQSGQADNWSKYIDFQPNSNRYQGNIYFYLPDDVDKSDVTQIKIKTNFKGWSYSKQKWYWKLRNFSTNKWVTIGKNTFAQDWVWAEKSWVRTSTDFIKSSNGEIRLQYRSNNDRENSNLDYLIIEITVEESSDEGTKLLEPPGNGIYHAVYPDFGGFEDEVSAQKITDFENLAGKNITWAYFSNNWFDGIHFPADEVNTIHNAGRIPFIRMMPRNEDEDCPDPVYTMQAIINGEFDTDLAQWAQDANNCDFPLLVEFGTECNGSWFPWNAKWNGKNNKTGYVDPALYDGTERFRDAYRHIIDLFNDEGVDNITWFFHINVENDPQTNWNKMKNYYPGDNYIDWIGISVYGPQEPGEGWWSFEDLLSDNWNEIMSISNEGKPIAILELGVIDYPSEGDKAQWITDAYNCVGPGGTFDQDIDAMSWWHETFDQTNLRINSSPEAQQAYHNAVYNSIFVTSATFSQ